MKPVTKSACQDGKRIFWIEGAEGRARTVGRKHRKVLVWELNCGV